MLEPVIVTSTWKGALTLPCWLRLLVPVYWLLHDPSPHMITPAGWFCCAFVAGLTKNWTQSETDDLLMASVNCVVKARGKETSPGKP